MQALNQKKLVSVVSILAFLIFLFIGIGFASYYTYRSGAYLERDESEIGLLLGKTVHFKDGSVYAPLPAGNYEITLKNEGKADCTVTLFFAKTVSVNSVVYPPYTPVPVELAGEENVPLSYSCEKTSDFGFTETGREHCSFVFDQQSFAAAARLSEAGSDVVFVKKTKFNEMKLDKPLRVFGPFSFSAFSAASQAKEGRMVIAPDEEYAASFGVYCPNLDFYTDKVIFQNDPLYNDYYFKVKTLNGEKTDLGSYPVRDFGMLSALQDNGFFLRDDRKITVRFLEEVTLESDLNFGRVFCLDFKAGLVSRDHVISLRSLSEETLEVTLAEGAEVLPESLYFNAPFCDLVWTSVSAAPIAERMDYTQNLRSYNGTVCTLGGLGEGEVRLTLPAGSVEGVEEEVAFTRVRNLLVAYLPYGVTMEQLSAVHPVYESENRVYFETKNDSGSVDLSASPHLVLQDDNGNYLHLMVKILRETKKLPVVYVETENHAPIETKEQYVAATFALDAGESGFSSVPLTAIRIRGRGNSTWEWEKKPYKIHFEEPVSVLGLAPAEEWALLANYADKSLMRNHVALEMARILSFDYTPTQEAVDVFLNGDYIGVYSLGEHLEAGEGRVEFGYDPGKIDCGYFLEVGGVVSGVDVLGKNYFHAGLLKFILIKSPESDNLTKEQYDFIKEYMIAANDAVKAHAGYEEYLDVDSVIDWIIMTELTNNTDCAYRRSCYFTKDSGGKLKMGPVWDFDLALGNFSRDDPDYDTWSSYNMDDDYVGETWTYHLFQDPAFRTKFKARWDEVRDKLLGTADRVIEEEYARIAPSADFNFTVWNILGRKVAFERRDTTRYPTYSSQIRYLQTFLKNRADWIDSAVKDW